MYADYQTVMLCIIAAMTLIAIVNLALIPSLRRSGLPEERPRVSILVPVRNEEAAIEECLRRLTDQDYPDYEVVVLDDSSEDATFERASRVARENRRLRVVRGKSLPAGWTGKGYACHQLSEMAEGELFLFTDADTLHSPHSVSAAVAALQNQRAGLLTAIPRQIMITFWEKMFLPMLHFVTWCYLPLPLVRLSRNPKFAMANGQYMLFRRDTYRAIGGHASVRSALVEDVWLSRRVKQWGYRLAIVDGGDAVACRMYRNFREIWEGFSKNLFPGFRYSVPAITMVVVFNSLTSVLPFVTLAGAIAARSHSGPWLSLAAAQAALIIAVRLLMSRRFRMEYWPAILHPAAMTLLIAIAFNSCRWVLFAGGARWKGRRYDFHKQPLAQE